MTEIAFHVNHADKVGYACRLLRKAWATGARVVVTGEAALLRDLDVSLWTFSAADFVPHCHAADASAQLQARSPIVLAEAAREAPHHEVLVNLGPQVPDGFERFERLIEVVGADDADLQAGRQRWKHYAHRGYALARHEPAAEAR